MVYDKYIKKASRFAKKKTKERYQTKTGGVRINQVLKDVAALKKMINAEKQNAETRVTTEFDLAQFNATSGGWRAIDILPTISQGFGEDNRKGDSLKIASWVLQLQVYNNGALSLTDYEYKFLVVTQPTNPVGLTGAGNIVSNMFEPNSFSGIQDYYSNRNYQHYKDFKILGIVKGKLRAQDNSTSNSSTSKQHTLARKADFHIRYDKGTNTPLNNPITLIALCDDGDRNTTNKMFFKYSMKVFYYDN